MPTTRPGPRPRTPRIKNPATTTVPAEATVAASLDGLDRAARTRIARAVTGYLDLIAGVARPVKNPRTVESELARIGRCLAQPRLSPAVRLRLLQDRRDIKAHGLPGPTREQVLREGFIAHAAEYALIHRISYQTFLEFGVPAEDLASAGLRPAVLHLIQGS